MGRWTARYRYWYMALLDGDDASAARFHESLRAATHDIGVMQDPENVISGTFGDNLLKARLRAHPEVAAIHHADLLAPKPTAVA